MIATQSPTGKAGRAAKNPLSDAAGFDLYRLDCAVDALRASVLTATDRAELARIAAKLADLMEPIQ
jgi:hypothetical protein